jgi:hypothetical protein
VTYADGTMVYVPATYNSKTPTVPGGTAGAVPLTVAMMSSPSSSYYANPNLINGQINSGSNAAKVLSTVSPTHGAILTGATGLPISDLQLLSSSIPGIGIPGSINVAQNGDATTGYPVFSFNVTSVYVIPTGWLKGVRLGGTVSAGWKNRAYYYYPQGIGAASGPNGSPRSLFFLPTTSRFDAIAGYARRFRHVTFSSQINISNVFNHYEVIVYPNQVTGWTSPSGLTANFNQQPRMYTWTNQVSF